MVTARVPGRSLGTRGKMSGECAGLYGEAHFPYGVLVKRTRRSHRADRDAPNESFVAQMRAELCPETCFCPYGALVERTDRSRRADRGTLNESSVAHI